MLKICLRSVGVALCCLCFMTAASPARADWPSAEDVVKAVAPAAGLSADQVEFVLFSLKEPSCASTIVSYTVAQDYSLAAFIVGLKAAKLDGIPEIPKMSHGQCKAYSPMQQAYIIIDTLGDKFISNSGPLKETVKGYVEEGKSSLDAEVASIPYVGTILTNWDCGCDAAYMTRFKSEKMVDDKVRDVVAIAGFVKSGDIPSALERMITALGPQVACDLGAAWTGVSSVPVVSDVAAEACNGVAKKAVGWVVSGAGTMAEAVGLIGGEHIPPEEYYKNMYSTHLKPDWREWISLLYDKCYGYFEPTNMAASTAKKVCNVLQQRFIDENEGKEQLEAWGKDPAFKDFKQQGEAAVFMGDAEYTKLVLSIDSACESYAAQKYPKIKIYEKNYASDISPFSAEYCNPALTMDKVRADRQQSVVYDMINKQSPFCAKGDERNVVVCDKRAIQSCFAEFADICKKSTMKKGGMEVPCCKLGTGTDDSYDKASEWADKVAKKETPFCKTSESDPLRVTCALQESYDHCRKTKTSWGGLPDCETAEKYPNGTPTSTCCTFDTSWLESVPGVKDMKGFVATANIQYKGACGIGGMQEAISYDPRAVSCASGKPLDACKAKFPDKCKKLASNFVEKPCCETAVFAVFEDDTKKRTYDPHDRSAEELALTEKVVSGSSGYCHYGQTKDGKEDRFKVVCDSIASTDMCKKVMDRPAMTPCSAKLSDDGWVTSPCCEHSAKALHVDARDIKVDPNDLKAPGMNDVSGHDLGLAPGKTAEGPNGRKEEGASRTMGTVKRSVAPDSGGTGGIKGLNAKSLDHMGAGLGSSGSAGTPSGHPRLRTGLPASGRDDRPADPSSRTPEERGREGDTQSPDRGTEGSSGSGREPSSRTLSDEPLTGARSGR